MPEPYSHLRSKREPPCQSLPAESPAPPPPPPPLPPKSRPQRKDNRDTSISGFFRGLLPRDFDTGDLLIVVLLLLMAGDCADSQNTALLTLALYFFM